jgi:hypothetical protein
MKARGYTLAKVEERLIEWEETMPAVMVLPTQYDHPPSIPVIDKVMSRDEVTALCSAKAHRALPAGEWFNGCSAIVAGKCYIWRVDDAAVFRHERAHCNGWPYNHPPYMRY